MCKKNNPLGYLTTSMVDRYIHCPRQFFYEYVEGFSQTTPNANLVFGSIMHEVIAEGIIQGKLDVNLFLQKWSQVGELAYSGRQSFESLKQIGKGLMNKLLELNLPERDIEAVEKSYETELADGTIFKGTDDVEFLNGSLLDWKTSGSRFLPFRPDLDDQLTAYSMLSRRKKVGYGVLLKKKTPEIKFLNSSRDEEDWADYEVKVMKCAADIEAGFFHKNPSQMQCSYCPFRCLCLGNVDKADTELRQTGVKDRYADKLIDKVALAQASS